MKILVCISKTPDTTAKIAFTDNNTKFAQDGVQWIINPYDEWYALVRALELKEALGGTVTLINVGPADNDQVIRKGLAIGADDAVRIQRGHAKQHGDTAKKLDGVGNEHDSPLGVGVGKGANEGREYDVGKNEELLQQRGVPVRCV